MQVCFDWEIRKVLVCLIICGFLNWGKEVGEGVRGSTWEWGSLRLDGFILIFERLISMDFYGFVVGGEFSSFQFLG